MGMQACKRGHPFRSRSPGKNEVTVFQLTCLLFITLGAVAWIMQKLLT